MRTLHRKAYLPQHSSGAISSPRGLRCCVSRILNVPQTCINDFSGLICMCIYVYMYVYMLSPQATSVDPTCICGP